MLYIRAPPSASCRIRSSELEVYQKTPGTMGTIRRADRMLAAQLYQRGLAVKMIENALVLAATRRTARPADAPTRKLGCHKPTCRS
jgi:hypothetical protein